MGKKYLVVSDNHGSMANLEYVIDRFHGQIEGFIHCGDMEIPPEMLEELAGCRFIWQPETVIIILAEIKKMFLNLAIMWRL